ncbi:MAG TPA: hypothetical protein VM328_03665 [Fimbriimonadaceae bacterium]|nr:hypothetical protein [Fimbriimonadaceae bacterium]
MKMTRKIKLVSLAAMLAVAAVAGAQFKEVLKVVGVGAAVKQFGPQINSAINKLSGHRDTNNNATKVVPILSVGRGRGAIGAAQVMGPRGRLSDVGGVAQLEGEIFGEFRIRAYIPIKGNIDNLSRVDGVGVSGIMDLKL